MSPKHSIDFCPICGGGLCGIRICGIERDDDSVAKRFSATGSTEPHGLILCDECEAIWLEPDTSTAHQYPDVEDAKCPICKEALFGPAGRWASADDIETLNWRYAVNPDLDMAGDEELA